MQTTDVFDTAQGQAVVLPEEFRFSTRAVTIRREGAAVILEPLKPAAWPDGFFESIRIDDPAFLRPEQGALPPAPKL